MKSNNSNFNTHIGFDFFNHTKSRLGNENNKAIDRMCRCAIPDVAYILIESLISTLELSQIIDPYATPFSPVVMNENIKADLEISSRKIKDLVLTMSVLENKRVNYRHTKKDEYDAVIFLVPPDIDGENSKNYILDATKWLTDSGILIALVSYFDIKFDNSILDDIIARNFSIKAAIEFPRESEFSLDCYCLIIIQRHSPHKTYYSSINSFRDIDAIIKDFQEVKSGGIFRKDKLIISERFFSFEIEALHLKAKNAMKSFDFPRQRLADIFSQHVIIDNTKFYDLESEDVLCFTRNGSVKQVQNQDDLESGNCFVLNKNLAIPEYLVEFFLSEAGIIIKDIIFGIYPHSIGYKETIMSIEIPLPCIEKQNEFVMIDKKIQRIGIVSKELKGALWKGTESESSIIKKTDSFFEYDELENWIDSLPYPLASILWRYFAAIEYKTKIEYLLHFFEAFAQFMSMLVLSTFISDESVYAKEKTSIIGGDQKFKSWYKHATFGGWVNLLGRLTKISRKYLSNPKTNDEFLCLYNSSSPYLEMLKNRELINILDVVRGYRNKWKGHGGVSSNAENSNRLMMLEKELQKIRECIKYAFSESTLISGRTCEYESGIFRYTVKVLSGNKTPFRTSVINSKVPLDKNSLYFHHESSLSPIKIIPFMKYFDESDAVYFYSCIDSGVALWVSYNYEEISSIHSPIEQELERAFSYLDNE